MKKIAVVILNWNGASLLKQFLPSVIEYSQDASIYVIDNASTDNSVKLLKKEFPSIQIIINKDNYGFAKGYNEGLRTIKEPYLALVNSDIEVTKNWLEPIIRIFDNELNTAIIQPKILDYKKKTDFEYAGAAGGFIDKYGFPYCRGRIFEKLEKDNGQYNDEVEIFWASGACFFIRNSVFSKLNGFDNDFFAHQEEIDLCWRSFNDGNIAKYCGSSTVYHVGGATLDSGSPKKTFLNFRNSLFMLTKNLPSKNLLSILFIRLLLDGIASIRFLTQGKFKHIIAVLKAHYSFYIGLRKHLKKRTKINKNNYFKTNSIVYQHFVLKKEKY
ncbi:MULTISPECIES: glycosyltransferase family 2 protein [Flavobacterium]|uniref:Glycosyltransferase family 2 protein n=1 Tax=Flavobacterium jumunjinense TaxID=998845 RepID=A0ABV5GNJ7_9FLAO|nr:MULTISPECIES: glycosyltransferase family 2 protein [Flavobacterium]